MMNCNELTCPNFSKECKIYKLYTHANNNEKDFLLYSEHIQDKTCPKLKDKDLQEDLDKYFD